MRSTQRVRRRRLTALVVLLALLGGCAYVADRLSAAGPAVTFARTLPASVTVPGATPQLPWPAGSDGYLAVSGIGSFADARAQRAVPIGSVAKVMTAYLVLRAHPLAAGQAGPAIPVTAQDVAGYQRRRGQDQSLIPLVAGETLTERQALQALLLPSANDVATMLARWQAGSVPAFVTAMNATARRLGMTATRYTDPSGLLGSTVSSARDQVLLAERAMALPAFAAIVAEPTAQLPYAGTVTNYNGLLGRLGVDGVKTGSTGPAGGALVFAARRTVGGRVVTFVGALFAVGVGLPPSPALALNQQASAAVLAAAEAAVRTVTAVPAGTRVGVLRPAWGALAPLRTASALTLPGWPGLRVRVRVQVPPLHRAGVGAPTGRATLVGGGGGAGTTAAVVASVAVAAPSAWWRLTHP